ncbi:hypothetical protein BD770DRAFT_402702 [Pilaira anomala]|nr:hypothetical protein BD770DRAFT_402702 [Pilaira anomala]
MTFQDVPSEVLDKIFLLLPNSAVRECIFVCKSWNITATRIFYTTVTLTRKNIRKFISTAQPVNYWVRQLKFDIDYPQLFKFTTDQFKVLINQVPKLRLLDLAGLSNKSVIEPLLEILYEDDTLDCIEEIKVDHELSSQARELYFRTVYKYKDTMSCLHLNYLRYTIHGGYLSFLPEFKQLTFLSISNDLLNGDRYMLISSVLDLCPKLIRFKLQTKRHFPDASKVGLLKRMKEDNNSSKKNQHVYNMKLKELEFELHDFHEGYMEYVIYYTSLDRFYLNMLETDIYEWLVDKEDQMNSFASYLSTINNVTIKAQSQATKSRQRMSTQDRMERNWMFLNTVIGKRKLDCHLYLSMKGYDDSQKFEMKIINNQTIELEYQVKPEYPTNNLISLFQFGHNNGARIINSIEIGDAIRYTLNDILQVLQCAINKCPQLKLVVIHRAKLCYRLQSIPYPYNIQFDQHLIPVGQAKSSNSSGGSIGLNHVMIQNATISRELIHILTDCLPNLKVLKLKECEPIDWLDLEGIQELKYLEIDIFVSQPRRILITLELCSGQHRYYYESKNHQTPFISTTQEEETQKEDTFYVTIKCNKIEKIVIHTTSVCASELIVPVVQH